MKSELSLETPCYIIFYDGDCGLCNRFIIWVLERDHNKQFKFCSLQSDFAQSFLNKHGIHIQMNTMYVGTTQTIYKKSNAALFIFKHLYPRLEFVFLLCQIAPQFLRDFFYSIVVKNRHQIFRSKSCPLMKPEWGDRFLGHCDDK